MHRRHRSHRSRSFSRRLALEPLEDRNLLSFLPAVNYPVGTGASHVAVADLKGDGIQDLVVPSYLSDQVNLLFGNGDGSFQPAQGIAFASSPLAVAVGDFNGDGIPDLAVTDTYGNVNVLLGNGDGTFQAPTTYADGLGGPVSVVAGDFDGDGTLDLATANESSSTVSVLLGNGDGTFQGAVNYSAGSMFVNDLAVGDLAGDGILDIVVVNYNAAGTVTVLLGNGDGTFQMPVSYATGSYPYSVAVGDLNGDGIPDLAVPFIDGAQQPTGVSVLLGNGDGSFQAPVSYITNSIGAAVSVAIADVNADGIPDLAVTQTGSSLTDPGSVSVLLGNGDGSFQALSASYAVGPDPRFMATGDFNGDGFPDLVVPNWNNGGASTVSVLINAADWGGGAPRAAASGGLRGVQSLAGQLAVNPPPTVFPTNVAPSVPPTAGALSPLPVPGETPRGQTALAEASPGRLSITMGPPARDTGLEGWADPVADVLAPNLFR